MRLQKVQKALLTQAGKASGQWVSVTEPGMPLVRGYTARRAAHTLAALGLVEIRKGVERWAPRTKRLQIKLTEFGETFVDIFGHELLHNSRIMAAKFKRITGTPMPHATTPKVIPWQTGNRHRANSQNHASAQASA